MLTYVLSVAAVCCTSRAEWLWWKPHGLQSLNYSLADGPAAGCHQTNLEFFFFLLNSVPNFWKLLSPPPRGWNVVPRQIPGVSNLNSFPGTLYQVLSALCLHLVCSSGAAGHLLPPKPSPCLTPLRVPGSPARRASLLCQMFPQVNSMEHQPRETAVEKGDYRLSLFASQYTYLACEWLWEILQERHQFPFAKLNRSQTC